VTSSAGVTTFAILAPSITITETASPTTFSQANELITYTYVVTNTGNLTLNNVIVTDSATPPNVLCATALLSPSWVTPSNSILTCTSTYTIQPADVTSQSPITQSVTVNAEPACQSGACGAPVAGAGRNVISAKTQNVEKKSLPAPAKVAPKPIATINRPLRAAPTVTRPVPAQVVQPVPAQVVQPNVAQPVPAQVVQPVPAQVVQPVPAQPVVAVSKLPYSNPFKRPALEVKATKPVSKPIFPVNPVFAYPKYTRK
jgi:uncharacterized repeat protein (TIGR01451 family)